MEMAMIPAAERRAQWLADRRNRITATDVAKILGISPYGRPIDVYCEKLGIDEDKGETKSMRRGKRRERLVLEAYEDEEETQVIRSDPYELVVSPSDPLFACTPDARRSDNGIPVEAKSVRFKDAQWGPALTDDFPLHFAVQMTVQMHCLDADECHLPVEFAASDDDYARYTLKRNRSTEVALLDQVQEWHERHVVKQVPPDPDGSKQFEAFLQRQFPQANLKLVYEASEGQDARGLEMLGVKSEIARLEMEEARLRQLFEAEMETASELRGKGWYILWRTSKDGTKIDWEKVAREYAEEVGFHVPIARPLSEYIARHTRATKGARPFLFKEGK